jgi:hypothetical protein
MENLNITFVTQNNRSFLQFDFAGELKESVAIQGISKWREEMSKLPAATKIDIIYNCTNMTGFETEARRNWQNAMKEFKTRLGEIWIVSDNIFILGAAKTMGLLTGFNMKVSRSLKDIGR